MKYIKSIWRRILISILMASGASALTQMAVESDQGEPSKSLFYLTAIFAFIGLSSIVWYDKYKYFFFPDKAKKDAEDDDILDSDI